MGWERKVDDQLVPLTGIEHATVRQIAHEVLRTLEANYRKEPSFPGPAWGKSP